ncbi:MAG: LPXTG cell wall anchor domain-containing protein [Micromonosporaceae bacterium]|nr:LPXTG cell wall anchor domain-containing protein [Micromonosporaceae bacterium]
MFEEPDHPLSLVRSPSVVRGSGGLPVSGAPTGLLVLAGFALIVAGAIGLVIVRRRRTRFVA